VLVRGGKGGEERNGAWGGVLTRNAARGGGGAGERLENWSLKE
jgi:hypothetical protein